MNQTTAITIGVILLAILGGIAFYSFNSSQLPWTTATSTPATNNNVDNIDETPDQVRVSSAPVVTTNSKVAPTDTTVVVTGSVVPNGALTSYWYEYGATTALGGKTSIQLVGSGYNTIPAPAYITNLTKDTTYYYRVVAQNQFGSAAGGQHSFITTHGNPPPVGSAPSAKTLQASGISRSTANLNGEITPNKTTTQYWFEYGSSADLGNTTAFASIGDGAGSVSASQSVSNLVPLTTYFYRVNAQNQFGTVNGAILTFKTNGPAAAVPPSVRTSAENSVGTSTVTLRGTINPNGADTVYWFEYSTDSLLGSILLKTTGEKSIGDTTGSVSVTTDISGLAPKTNYYYRLVARNTSGITRGDRGAFKTR